MGRWALCRQVVPESLIDLVEAVVKISGQSGGGKSDSFGIGVGFHQGSVLSYLLFILAMEEPPRECRVGGMWEPLYADDLALTAETLGEVELMFG